jgi:glucose-6-phosphate 1-dehydrogenase
VPGDSLTPTYVAGQLQVDNERWQGVPFHVTAGKGLGDSMTEIRIKFREVAGSMFSEQHGVPAANELVIRVQPDESIYLRVINKVPGMKLQLESRDLNLLYKSAFDTVIPEAYESLILDVVRGDKSLFIRRDELAAAWDIFTPVLHELEQEQVRPEPYTFGSDGPARVVSQ